MEFHCQGKNTGRILNPPFEVGPTERIYLGEKCRNFLFFANNFILQILNSHLESKTPNMLGGV